MSSARQRWLEAGVAALSEEGSAAAVRIDRLAARLGLSRGSFYHHFAGAEDFKLALLDHLRDEQVTTFAGVAADGRTGDARGAKEASVTLISRLGAARSDLRRPRLEAALRAWALTDSDAARTQASIDENRLESIRAIWRQVTDDEEEVRLAALLPYVIAVGSAAIMPPLSDDDLHRLFERIITLVPDDRPQEGDGS
ncbi:MULTISPECIES: TetR/AcrR family transcriptional regulator [unclassified Brevibacterium]|uniref:TetR/AcrR family transcriptional regulator n=1 Tax=unclassified Brevibacterium TaxID=2614124 RepID=UPI001092CD46|nr:TetR/AcrR family transcriptional regulator [Brevibacterium sp. S22]TGD29139.1 TetR/AcrR family transcriptional regulator [Brevibacterium sp. S22]